MGRTAKRRQRGRGPARTESTGRGEPDSKVGQRQPAPAARDRRTWLVAVALVVLVTVTFLPALAGGFVDWDDESNFIKNAQYRGLGWPQWKWAWTTLLLGVYQPVAWLLLGAQYVVFGMNPRGYHLVSLLLHAANAVALYALVAALLARCRPDPFLHRPWARAVGAGLATGLFMAHPLRVEVVAWASCQPYLPCALFALLSVLAYLRAVGDRPFPRRGWLVVSFALGAASMLSKAPSVGLPAVLLILDVYPLRRLGGGPGRWFGPSSRGVWLEKVPFVAASLAIMGLAIAAKADAHTLDLTGDDLAARIARACYGIWFYLIKTAVPRDITALYPIPRPLDRSAPAFAASILATLAVTGGLLTMARRRPGLLAAWLSYLALLAPCSGFFRIGPMLAADRYSYLSMTGLVVPVAAGLGLGLAWGSSRRPRTAALALAVAVAAIAGLGYLTWNQCRIWRDSASLWSHVLDHGGGRSPTARAAMGLALGNQGRFEEARAELDEAVRLDPIDVLALGNRAAMLATCPDAAYRDGREALASATLANELSGWSLPMLLDPLAAACAEVGDFEAAVRWEQKAIDLSPDGMKKEDYRARLELYRTRKPYHGMGLFPASP